MAWSRGNFGVHWRGSEGGRQLGQSEIRGRYLWRVPLFNAFLMWVRALIIMGPVVPITTHRGYLARNPGGLRTSSTRLITAWMLELLAWAALIGKVSPTHSLVHTPAKTLLDAHLTIRNLLRVLLRRRGTWWRGGGRWRRISLAAPHHLHVLTRSDSRVPSQRLLHSCKNSRKKSSQPL